MPHPFKATFGSCIFHVYSMKRMSPFRHLAMLLLRFCMRKRLLKFPPPQTKMNLFFCLQNQFLICVPFALAVALKYKCSEKLAKTGWSQWGSVAEMIAVVFAYTYLPIIHMFIILVDILPTRTRNVNKS